MSQINGKGIVVELSDGPHVIKFTVNVLSDVEEVFGSLDLFQESLDTRPFSSCRQVIKLLIGCETLAQAGDLMTDVELKPIVDGIGKALIQAIAPNSPEAQAKFAELANPPQPPSQPATTEAATAGTPSSN